jgi:hypothetical protein
VERKVSRHELNTLRQEEPVISHLSAVLFSNSGIVPLSNRPYELSFGGEILQGTTDGDGYLQHELVEPGDWSITIDGVQGYVPTVADPEERLAVRIKGYMIVHEVPEQAVVHEDEEDEDDPDDEDWEPLDEEGGF